MSHKLHLGLGLIGFVEKPESVVKWWKDRCFSTDVLKMMVLLADFTFEALSMVNASGCPNRLAFDLGSTLSTFLHVRLEGASWWRWLSQRIIEQETYMRNSPCSPFHRRSCLRGSSRCQWSLPRTRSNVAGFPKHHHCHPSSPEQ